MEQSEIDELMKGGSSPKESAAPNDDKISWDDVQVYIRVLNAKTGQQYRLPSEAEWEYAARAGTVTKHYWGDGVGENNANCFQCGSQWDNKTTAPVGSFKPNAFGLHDMHGNVWEWVQDWYHESYAGAPMDGSAWEKGGEQKRRVVRGGSWNMYKALLRLDFRDRFGPALSYSFGGFRLARAEP